MSFIVNELVNLDLNVTNEEYNPVTGLTPGDFSIKLYDPLDSEVSSAITITIFELGDGYYRTEFTPNLKGKWLLDIKHSTYFPWGKSKSILVSEENSDTIKVLITRILGLAQENYYVDNTSYDEDGNMISSRIRIYSDSTKVGSDESVITTYLMTAEYDNDGNLESYKVVKG